MKVINYTDTLTIPVNQVLHQGYQSLKRTCTCIRMQAVHPNAQIRQVRRKDHHGQEDTTHFQGLIHRRRANKTDRK